MKEFSEELYDKYMFKTKVSKSYLETTFYKALEIKKATNELDDAFYRIHDALMILGGDIADPKEYSAFCIYIVLLSLADKSDVVQSPFDEAVKKAVKAIFQADYIKLPKDKE